MAWLLLLMAGAFEIGFAICLEPSNGLTRLWPSVGVVVFGIVAVVALSHAVDDIPIGTAYAVFTGIGGIGTVLVGILALGDPVSAARLASLGLVLGGMVGLRLAS
jgi:quaternary ammonium compound-resistance protein SugE